MTWTSTPPTEPGYYWHRFVHDGEPGAPDIVHVDRDGGGLTVAYLGTDAWDAVEPTEEREWWSGPIQPPGSVT